MKKIVLFFLILTLLLSVFSLTVFADGGDIVLPKVTIYDDVTLKDTSSYSLEDGFILGVKPNTSVYAFAQNLEPSFSVYNGSDKIIAGTVKTGNVVKYSKGSAIIVVDYDCNGDGKIDSTDCIIAKRILLKIGKTSEIAQKSLDTNRDGKVDSTDYIVLKRFILGI